MSTKKGSRAQIAFLAKRVKELDGVQLDNMELDAALAVFCKVMNTWPHRIASAINRLLGRQDILRKQLLRMYQHSLVYRKGKPDMEVRLTGKALPTDYKHLDELSSQVGAAQAEGKLKGVGEVSKGSSGEGA